MQRVPVSPTFITSVVALLGLPVEQFHWSYLRHRPATWLGHNK